jgi:hypothetical protein
MNSLETALMLKPILAFGLLAVPVLATPPAAATEPDTLMGRYAFDWKVAPLPNSCLKIDAKLLATLRSKAYACDLTERNNSASGETFVQCTRIGGVGQYLIFKTAKACANELETQAANGG